ncbi:Altered inheritance of mitochondria protein 9, mitochondrial [Neolecta irregularis DAH-3]|uniref:Altered inheritance of mitochondria protein 9, mitochondrial n=1 Tax=Neolecta irregularis (strain DAH-3) TaxID=1198029 RepID=A0A1U7LTA5_NEOID|nr:Altered inheritance of mitochondria protein 9, mitochondrial [Neolecta irregularis DAH-3]|eukprot:OLL25905.1 Altered inheritance of mitochondria protein 9, mitochondrial [Neolecta irregularis DAH-3]
MRTGKSKYIPFNIYALERIASKDLGSDKICSIRLTVDSPCEKWFEISDSTNQSSCIVKIPFPSVEFYRVENEVHTIDYLRQNTTLPVPRILSHCSHSENAVGMEYIILEPPLGRSLDEVWNILSSNERKGYILELIDFKLQILRLTSDKIGCIYKKSTHFAVGPLLSFLEHDIPECGPWHTLDHYLHSLAALYLSHLKSRKSSAHDTPGHFPSRLSKVAIQKFLQVAPYLQPPKDLCKFVLHHPDLSLSNIYVYEGRISCITGWSSSAFQPLFEAVQPPKCLQRFDGESIEATLLRKLYYDKITPLVPAQFTSPRLDFFRQLLRLILSHASPKGLSCAIVDIVEHWNIFRSNTEIECPITVSKREKRKTLRCESLPAVSEVIFDHNRWEVPIEDMVYE